jgi:hypothetical protein
VTLVDQIRDCVTACLAAATGEEDSHVRIVRGDC